MRHAHGHPHDPLISPSHRLTKVPEDQTVLNFLIILILLNTFHSVIIVVVDDNVVVHFFSPYTFLFAEAVYQMRTVRSFRMGKYMGAKHSNRITRERVVMSQLLACNFIGS